MSDITQINLYVAFYPHEIYTTVKDEMYSDDEQQAVVDVPDMEHASIRDRLGPLWLDRFLSTEIVLSKEYKSPYHVLEKHCSDGLKWVLTIYVPEELEHGIEGVTTRIDILPHPPFYDHCTLVGYVIISINPDWIQFEKGE